MRQLLAIVDDRGFERSSQQVEFHEAFINAVARILFREDWALAKPDILKRNGWEKSYSEVLISTPRRFGKTFRCVASALYPAPPPTFVCPAAWQFSPPSSRLLVRWRSSSSLRRGERPGSCWRGSWSDLCSSRTSAHAFADAEPLPGRFVRLLGCQEAVVEFNQEVLRLKSFEEGKTSLIRSFPSKVGVRSRSRPNEPSFPPKVKYSLNPKPALQHAASPRFKHYHLHPRSHHTASRPAWPPRNRSSRQPATEGQSGSCWTRRHACLWREAKHLGHHHRKDE